GKRSKARASTSDTIPWATKAAADAGPKKKVRKTTRPVKKDATAPASNKKARRRPVSSRKSGARKGNTG
ncbi:unnamed protein product, partial [marine sediment metagenome]